MGEVKIMWGVYHCLPRFIILAYILQLRMCQTNCLRVIWTVYIHYTISEVKITLKAYVLLCSVLHITSSPNLAVSWLSDWCICKIIMIFVIFVIRTLRML